MKARIFSLTIVLFVLVCTYQVFSQESEDRKLLEYCWTGNLNSIKTLKEADFNYDDKSGITPLHCAAFKGYLDIVKYLVENKAKVNVRTNTRVTPLHLAAQQGHKEVVEFLINKGADIEDKTEEGKTAFALALEQKQEQIVKYLLELQKSNKIDNVLKEQDINQNTLLHLGATLEDVGLVKTAIDSKVDLDDQNIYKNTALHIAAVNGDSDIVSILIKGKSDLDIQNEAGNTPLHLALVNNHLGIASCLIDAKADINIKNKVGNTPLHIAAANGDSSIVVQLVTNKAKVNVSNENEDTPLHLSISNAHIGIAFYLLNAKADPETKNKSGDTPLHVATQIGNLELVKALLAKDVDVNEEEVDTRITPMHIATREGYFEITSLLLNSKAKINIQNTWGFTPLHSAVYNNHDDIVKLLLNKGARVDLEDNDSQTPLHVAAEKGNLTVVQLLIEKGAKINAEDKWDRTPLHNAVRGGFLDVVKFLVDKKADINAENIKDQTPLFLALTNNHLEIYNYLLSAGAKPNKVSQTWDYLSNALYYYSSHDIMSKILDINLWIDKDTTRFLEAINTTKVFLNEIRNNLPQVEKLLKDDVPLLSLAIIVEDSVFAQNLIEHNADITQTIWEGRTPLHFAAATGNIKIMRVILSKKHKLIEEKDDEKRTPLFYAVFSNNLETVKYLISEGANTDASNIRDQTILHYASLSSAPDLIHYLVTEKSLEVNVKDQNDITPLHVAAFKGNLETAKFLISKGAAVNSQADDGWTPLHIASAFGNLDVVKLLLAQGATYSDVEIKLWDKLTKGASIKTPSMHEAQDPTVILKLAVILFSQNYSKYWKPIHVASYNGHADVVKHLLDNGEAATLETNDKLTPIHLASSGGYIEAMKTLTATDQNLLRPYQQLSIVGLAFFQKYYGNFNKYILTIGANINAQDENGWTPLHWAVFQGNEAAATWLINEGADITRGTTSEVKLSETLIIEKATTPPGMVKYVSDDNRKKGLLGILSTAGAR